MELPRRLLGSVGTFEAQDRCIFEWCIHLWCSESVWARYRLIPMCKRHLETILGTSTPIRLIWKARTAQPRNQGTSHAPWSATVAGSTWWPRRCPLWSSTVFRSLESIDNLLKHFQNIEKWLQYEKIHRLCAAEVPTAPNSRGGSSIQKKH